MKTLTQAEEKVMQYIWQLDGAFTKEIIELFDEPKPSYSTVATLVRILEKKGFLKREAYGNTHKYLPVISKEKYSEHELGSVLENYFEGSMQRLVSFFSKKKNVSVQELDGLIATIEEIKNKEKE